MNRNTPSWFSAALLTLVTASYLVNRVSGDRTQFRITSHNVRVLLPTDTAYQPIDTVSPAMNTVWLQGLSLQQCVEQCSFRRKCRSINYSKMYAMCEVLEYRDDVVPVYTKRKSFVHISRADIHDAQQTTDACGSCDTGVCFPHSSTCPILECPTFRVMAGRVTGNVQKVGSRALVECYVDHILIWSECPTFRVMAGQVTGNVQTVGSRALVECYVDHILIGSGTSVCNDDGSWVGFKSCWWDCREPRPHRNALVEPGDTTNGTVRTYNCVEDFFLTGRPHLTQKNVTCHYGGTWDPGPRCVKDCEEANNASKHLAELMTGTNITDYDQRTYTCPAGYHVFDTWRHVDGWYEGDWMYDDEGNLTDTRTVTCNGHVPAWQDTRFRCARSCTGAPSDQHVFSLLYNITSNVTRANYTCRTRFTTFQGARRLHVQQPITVTCSDEDTVWQDANFHCELDCDAPPSVTNMGDVTHTFVTNLTTAHYACATGYKPWSGSEFVDHVVGTCNNRDRVWNYTDFSCAKVCENPPSVDHTVETTYIVVPDKTTATYACADGYKVWTGSVFLYDVTGTCDTPGGQWNFVDFTCAKVCENQPSVANTDEPSYVVVPDTTTAHYACADGYKAWTGSVFIDDVTGTCDTPGGQWNFVDFTCAKECHFPPTSPNIDTVTYTVLPDKTTATYACAEGHVVWDGSDVTSMTEVTIECVTAGGNWSLAPFVCLRNCANPPSNDNVGHVHYTVVGSETDALYTCNTYYVIQMGGARTTDQSALATCTEANSDWQNADFTCVPQITSYMDSGDN